MLSRLGLFQWSGQEWVRDSARVQRLDKGQRVVYGVVSDTTARKRAEEALRNRVKNNLQLVCALLNLQSSVVEDEKALQAFEESQNRVRSLAYIHEQLTHTANMARINMASYIHALVDSLRALYGSGDVAINVDVVDVTLPFDLVSSCGLLINELVSNAVKHAFPKGRTGEIDVALGAKADEYVLRVSDDGIGLPPGLNLENPASFGLTLVKLLTRQLRGTLKVDRQAGATFEVSFSA